MAKHAGKNQKKANEQPTSAFVPYSGKPKHGAQKDGAYQAPPAATRVMPVSAGGFAYAPEPEVPKKKSKKPLIIALSVIAALLVIVYVAGTVFFTGRFFPNTTMGRFDLSMKSGAEAQLIMDQAAESYTLTVKGLHQSFKVSSDEAGLSVDSRKIMDEALADNEPWTWPVAIFQTHDETASFAASSAATELNDSIRTRVEEYNKTAVMPVNATIAFDEDIAGFEIVEEQEGSAFDPDLVIEAVDNAVLNLDKELVLGDDELIKPTVFSDDERLKTAQSEANQMVKADLDLMMDGNLVTEVTPDLISQWITLDEDVKVKFADDLFGTWVDTLIAGCNTVGTSRTFTRADGKEITVSGGSYGWEVDSDALRSAVTEAVAAGTVGPIDIPVLQSGNGFTELGSRDWGNRYIDIDLTEQHARFYDDSGALVWESDVITGSPGEHATPTGVYYITWGMASPSTLIGEMVPETGKPEYETKVDYWMPFVGNSIGLHDAVWQYNGFGGDLYKQGYGSHGCVNLPLDKAAALYALVQKGDVVVCHW